MNEKRRVRPVPKWLSRMRYRRMWDYLAGLDIDDIAHQVHREPEMRRTLFLPRKASQ